MAEVSLRGIDKKFGTVRAVRNMDIEVAGGEFIVLLGPSGAGKTTTLRLIAGLETPDSGSVHIGGRDVTRVAPALRDVTFVFQQYSLYPHLSVFDNMAFPLRSPLRKTPEDEIKRKVMEVAKMLRMEDKLASPATKLSGGQMQRVAIGRALVRNPAVYLMDEPLSSLDAKLRNDMRLELKRIQQDLGATMVYVTHDQIEAMTLANRVGVLERGVLVQLGSPQDIYENPCSSYVASRLGSPRINLIPRSAMGDLAVPSEVATIGARAEHIRLHADHATDNGSVIAAIKRSEQLSDQHLVHLALDNFDGPDVVTVVPPGRSYHIGQSVSVEVVRPLWFDRDGHRVYDS
jgi:multiple sugar transport system ATP-binding protein